MSDELVHPNPDRLEAFAEGVLSGGDRAVVESHLLTCSRCSGEVEEWEALFRLLSELPSFDPAPGFANRVMAGVTLSAPWYQTALAALSRLVPQTPRGWALVSAFLALPGLTIFGALAWLLTQPGMTIGTLPGFLWQTGSVAALRAGGFAFQLLLESRPALWISTVVQSVLGTADVRELGAGAALFATLSAVSGWVLYRNLIRPSGHETRYVTYSF